MRQRFQARGKLSCGAPARRNANSSTSTISRTRACFVLKHYSSGDILNIGVGEDISIADFARTVAKVVGFAGTHRSSIHQNPTACRASWWMCRG